MPVLPPHLDEVRALVDARVHDALSARRRRWAHLGPASTELLDAAEGLASGGKRLRAVLAAVGCTSLAHRSADPSTRQRFLTSPPVVSLGAALELYQASALVHDDLIDDAPTRRGMPSSHVRLAGTHRDAAWLGASDGFGRSAAILLGDLFLSVASEVVEEATQAVAESRPICAQEARSAFNAMTAEVAVGQYLDLRGEVQPLPGQDEDHRAAAARMEREAMTVVVHKSARYSVTHPLVTGALLSGAAPGSPAVASLTRFGDEVGAAFQLRDDELGVFGDPEVTGKPAGGDLREGKRTVLVALAWGRADTAGRDALRAVLSAPGATSAQVRDAARVIEDCGARAEHEERISALVSSALATLGTMTHVLHPEALTDLTGLTHMLTDRRA